VTYVEKYQVQAGPYPYYWERLLKDRLY